MATDREDMDESPESEDLDHEREEMDAPLLYDEDSSNLVRDFEASEEGEQALRDIANHVLTLYQNDWDSSEEHRSRVARDLRLYSGFLKQKTFPFKGASTAHVPIMMENIYRLSTRLVSELFGDWVNVVGVQPVGPNDEEKAQLLSKHVNWQMRKEVPDFPRQMNRAVLAFLLVGYVISYSYYDVRRKQNRHEILMPSEFVMPYTYISTMPDLSDLPHYTWVRRMYAHDLEAMEGLWEHVDDVLKHSPPGWDTEPDSPERAVVAAVEGQDEPTQDLTAPYKLLHWEGWYKLPQQNRRRWCQVVLDSETKHVLLLSIHEQSDWRDRERYERQKNEREVYLESLRFYGQQVLQRSAFEDSLKARLATAQPGPEDAMRVGEYGAMPEPVEPQMPGWMSDVDEMPAPAARVPIYMFAHAVCIENLVGNMGFGIGRVLADYNKAGNTSLQQFQDAATLANCWTVVKPASIKLPENFGAKPGRIFTATGATGAELREGLVEFKAPPANPQLLDLVSLFRQFGESAAAAPGVLSGDAGKSGEPFKGYSTRLEQATKQLGLMAKSFSELPKQIYQNNAWLNSLHMPVEQFFYVNDDKTGLMTELRIGRDVYDRDYNVEFVSDMKFTSEANRIAEADQLLQLFGVIPALQINTKFQYDVIVEALTARGKKNLIRALGASPMVPAVYGQPPPPPPGMPPLPPSGPTPEGEGPGGMEPLTPPAGSQPE